MTSPNIPLTRMGRTGLKVSRLCLGTMTFGNKQWGCDEETSRAIIARYREAGGNFIDTADIYSNGISETIVGAAIKDHREEWVLATKAAGVIDPGANGKGLSRKHLMRACDNSLKRLGTDYIDLYQVHTWDHQVPVEETLSALTDLQRQGKVRYIGCSNFPGWGLMKAEYESRICGLAAFDCIQPQYSLTVRGIEREVLPAARALGIGIIPWSPLDGGLLSGKYRPGDAPPAGSRAADNGGPNWDERFNNSHKRAVLEALLKAAERTVRPASDLALGWVLAQPGITSPIIGVRRVDQLDANLAALKPLPEEALRDLTDASKFDAGYPYGFIEFFNGWINNDL